MRDEDEDELHLPAPSVWPFVIGGAVTLLAFGVTTSFAFSLMGAVLLVWGLIGWVREMRHG
jgi:hypothetical protein